MENNLPKSTALLLKYNFVFCFLERIIEPKMFDFLLNLVSPNSKIFDINQNLQTKIWEYLKQSGFFKDIVNSIIDPESIN